MRHTGFSKLTVVNGTPGVWGVTPISSSPIMNDAVFFQMKECP